MSKMAKDDMISEKEILLVSAHHLFEPLLPNEELMLNKYLGVDDSKCPYCNEKKEKIQSGSTSFGKNEGSKMMTVVKFHFHVDNFLKFLKM